MHELSIADNIITAVKAAMPQHGLTRVKRVGLRIGALAGVDATALRFGYAALSAETALAESELAIENVAAAAVCRKCSAKFAVPHFVFVCPKCESSQCDLIAGQELEIAFVEGE